MFAGVLDCLPVNEHPFKGMIHPDRFANTLFAIFTLGNKMKVY